MCSRKSTRFVCVICVEREHFAELSVNENTARTGPNLPSWKPKKVYIIIYKIRTLESCRVSRTSGIRLHQCSSDSGGGEWLQSVQPSFLWGRGISAVKKLQLALQSNFDYGGSDCSEETAAHQLQSPPQEAKVQNPEISATKYPCEPWIWH